MISVFHIHHNMRMHRATSLHEIDKDNIVWIDLCNPTHEEIIDVEVNFLLDLPSPDDMKEIETSSRLYEENDAHYMTMTYIAHAFDENPITTQMTFVMTKNTLVTLRYTESRLINHFMERLETRVTESTKTASALFVSLLDAIVDYAADILEASKAAIDNLNTEIFSDQKRMDYKALFKTMGRVGAMNSRTQESLVSLIRLESYAVAVLEWVKASRESKTRLVSLGTDIKSLLDQTTASTDRLTLLLDATLGLVGIEQNAIIKIFSVAAVIFLPPTLIASMYGMNFDHMPELHFVHGYPMALGMMVLSAVLPYLFFKQKGWL